MLRSPIIGVLGHVDHGKTSLLDAIRGSSVVEREAGRITQMIGASYIPRETIERIGKEILRKFGFQLHIPGLLFIDTPGHEAFIGMRERGGALADLAILVIDIKQGIQPQTVESINILKAHKTPFVVALTKIDLVNGWVSSGSYSFMEAWQEQPQHVKARLEELLYRVVGRLAEYGFDAEAFWRIKDFTKTVAIVPVSSVTKEGLAELLVLIAVLSQKYLARRLEIKPDEKVKGSVIEVKEERGMGTTADVILYEGILRRGMELTFLTLEGPVKTRVRGLFLPNVASNNPREKYTPVKEVAAAAGVKIMAPGLEKVIPGSVFGEDVEGEMNYIRDLLRESSGEGVLLKVDSLGSAEAVKKLLEKENIAVKKIGLGAVSKEDIDFAYAVGEKNPFYGVVIAFNVPVPKELFSYAEERKVRIINSSVIYTITAAYKDFVEEKKRELLEKRMKRLTFPAKIKVLPGFIFRSSKPAIFGIEVLAGKLRARSKLMRQDGKIVGEVRSIQREKQTIQQAIAGEKVAIAVDKAFVGRNVKEGDVLYTFLSKEELDEWESEGKILLSGEEKMLLQEIKHILLPKFLKR